MRTQRAGPHTISHLRRSRHVRSMKLPGSCGRCKLLETAPKPSGPCASACTRILNLRAAITLSRAMRSKCYGQRFLSIAIKITANWSIVRAAIASNGTIARTIAPLPAFVFARRISRRTRPSPANDRNPAALAIVIHIFADKVGNQSGLKNVSAKTGTHIASATARIPPTDLGGISANSQLTMAHRFLGTLFGLMGCDASIFTTSAFFCRTDGHCAPEPCKCHNQAWN